MKNTLFKKLTLWFSLIGLSLGVSLAHAAFDPNSEIKIFDENGNTNDFFGYSIALEGNRMAVGSTYNNSSLVAVTLYDFDGSNWVATAKLTIFDSVSYVGNFSISLDSNRLAVGAYWADIGSHTKQGAVYIFDLSGAVSTWQDSQQKLTATDGATEEYFGYSVSLDGNRLAVGAPWAEIGGKDYQGAAYIFDLSGAVSTWQDSQQKLTATAGAAGHPQFGASVSLAGNRLAVGASSENISDKANQGAVYIFDLSGAVGTWQNSQQKLFDPNGAVGDRFGTSISLDGNRVAVGANWADIDGKGYQGAAYIFDLSGAVSTWQDSQLKLTATDGAVRDYFGSLISLAGNHLAVGAHWADIGDKADQGAVYIFDLSGAVSTWQDNQQKLTVTDGAAEDWFGYSISLDGNHLAVGAPLADIGSHTNKGAVFVYSAAPTTFSIGGRVSGLSGRVTLQNNGGDDLIVTADGLFQFPTALTNGSAYHISVLTQPMGQTCDVLYGSGSGAINQADVTASVACGDNVVNVGCSEDELQNTFLRAISLQRELTLNLQPNCTYTLTHTGIRHTQGPSLTINGNQATIERSQATDIPEFTVMQLRSTRGTVTIKDLTIQGGKTDSNRPGGGLIATPAFLDNLTIQNNHAKACGGLVFSGEILNSTIKNNTAKGTAGACFSGTMKKTVVENNRSDATWLSSAGGLKVGAQTVTSKIIDTEIINNHSILPISITEGDYYPRAGGIYTVGNVEIINTRIADNTATHYAGAQAVSHIVGGLLTTAARPDSPKQLTLQNSLVDNNSGVSAGGIEITTGLQVNLNKTALSNNSGNSGGLRVETAFGLGTEVSDTELIIRDSAIIGNQATAAGGGIALVGGGVPDNSGTTATGNTTVKLINTTISGNQAEIRGGGIANDLGNATGVNQGNSGLTLVNTTVSNNTAPRGSGIDIGEYIYNLFDGTKSLHHTGRLTLKNTVLAGNQGGTDCYLHQGQVVENIRSLITNDAGGVNACGKAPQAFFAVVDDAKLHPLKAADSNAVDQQYKQHHPPMVNSPVINAGENSAVPAKITTDQIGNQRKVGVVDIGAIEAIDGLTPPPTQIILFQDSFETLEPL